MCVGLGARAQVGVSRPHKIFSMRFCGFVPWTLSANTSVALAMPGHAAVLNLEAVFGWSRPAPRALLRDVYMG